jgi:hypothetical protein
MESAFVFFQKEELSSKSSLDSISFPSSIAAASSSQLLNVHPSLLNAQKWLSLAQRVPLLD